MLSRRQALGGLIALFGPQAWTDAQDWDDPLYGTINSFDFAALAKKKLDPMAWDYLDGGSENELTLLDNRRAFDEIIIRPRMLVDVAKIDTGVEIFGKKVA